MRRTILIPPVFLFFLTLPGALFSQLPKLDAWILYEEGNAFFSSKEYGSALKKYQEAIISFAFFPEAEMGIGDVYRQEGEYDLAIAKYKKAYELRNSFYIPEMKYEALYKLAGIYETQQEYKLYEDTLSLIIQEDKNYNTESSRLRSQLESNFYAKGLDFILKLYRFQAAFPAQAHSKLGLFYYRTGNYSSAAVHLMYAAIYDITDAADLYYKKNADFEFTTLEAFIALLQNDKSLLDYLSSSGLFGDLYYLAGCVFKAGYPMHAKSIWQVIAKSKPSGSYADLSARQLKSPWTEPLLIQPEKR